MSWTTSAFVVVMVCVTLTVGEEASSLCHVPGCLCQPSPLQPDLVQVNCMCKGIQELSLGNSGEGKNQMPPENVIDLSISQCRKVVLRTRLLNFLPSIKNVSLSSIEALVIEARIYESRRGNGETIHVKTFQISEVRQLEANRQSFEGISVDGDFWLKDVFMPQVPSLAFNFDHVNEFSIFGSRMDRVSMWGFKLDSCGSFNVLGMSRFFSLASQAFHLRCNKFMLAYNVFVSLHDSSFDVRFGFADIQGNTFESMSGMPFASLRPVPDSELQSANPSWDPASVSAGGFVFRENKFSASPSLPSGSLAMPHFDSIDPDVAYIDIDANHFVCDCNKLSWLIGLMVYGHDREVLEQKGSSTAFIERVYETSGNCLQCSVTTCRVDESSTFKDFAQSVELAPGRDGQLMCVTRNGDDVHGGHGQLPQSSYDDEQDDHMDQIRRPTRPTAGPSAWNRNSPTRDEDDGTREVTNMDFSAATIVSISYLPLVLTVLIGQVLRRP